MTKKAYCYKEEKICLRCERAFMESNKYFKTCPVCRKANRNFYDASEFGRLAFGVRAKL